MKFILLQTFDVQKTILEMFKIKKNHVKRYLFVLGCFVILHWLHYVNLFFLIELVVILDQLGSELTMKLERRRCQIIYSKNASLRHNIIGYLDRKRFIHCSVFRYY